MPFNYPTFDVEIVRQVNPNDLFLPEPWECTDDRNLGCNREYVDMRDYSWEDVQRVIELEERNIRHIEESPDPDVIGSFTVAAEAEEDWDEEDRDLAELFLAEEFGPAVDLDLGIASTAAALSAAGCIPYISCNAGAFRGWHQEKYPSVDFYATPEAITLLLKCAEKADVGLEHIFEAYNPLTVYADDIRKMRDFANALLEHKDQFLPSKSS